MRFFALQLILSFAFVVLASASDNLAVVYTFDKNNDKRFNEFTKKDLKEIGYFLNDPHHRVNDAYELKFGTTNLELIGFSSILNEDTVRPLLNIDPRLGGFSPFNLLNFRKKSDKVTKVAHLTPEAILDIVGIKDKEIKEKYIASFKPLDAFIEKKLGGKKSYIPLVSKAKNSMMHYEIAFEEPEDIDDFLEEFQEKFEYAFETNGFVVAGFYNIKESFNSQEDVMPIYTSFWSYSLCHIPFSYTIFDANGALPIAGIFAPCAMYIYVKEGENKLVIGMPTLSSWAGALGITNKKKLDYIDKLDEEIPSILRGLGAKKVAGGNPLLRK
ncbi:MAG: hypothetical protein JJW00_07140 [Sulfurimonas sp.]|nr:hypothetical protein [Sulfurimonas sp.]